MASIVRYFFPTQNVASTGNSDAQGTCLGRIVSYIPATTSKILSVFNRCVKEHPVLTGTAIISTCFIAKVAAQNFWNEDCCSDILTGALQYSELMAGEIFKYTLQRYSQVVEGSVFNQSIPNGEQIAGQQFASSINDTINSIKTSSMSLFHPIPSCCFKSVYFSTVINTLFCSNSGQSFCGASGLFPFFMKTLGNRFGYAGVDAGLTVLQSTVYYGSPLVNSTLPASFFTQIYSEFSHIPDTASIHSIKETFSKFTYYLGGSPNLDYVDGSGPLPEMCISGTKEGLILGVCLGVIVLAATGITFFACRSRRNRLREQYPPLLTVAPVNYSTDFVSPNSPCIIYAPGGRIYRGIPYNP